jgi:hypothetical protein
MVRRMVRRGMVRMLLAALLLISMAGCGSVATIKLRDSSSIEGEIVGSSNQVVSVETNDGQEQVPRQEISDIDHPGNVALTLGVLLMGYGAVNIALGAPKCGEKGAAFCTGVFLPAAVGIPLFGYGWRIWRTSVLDARPPRTKKHALQMHLRPMLLLADQSRTGGFELAATF